MSSEESIISIDKSEFHGFPQANKFDFSYAYLMNNTYKQEKLKKDKYEMYSSNCSSHQDSKNTHENTMVNESINSWGESSFQENRKAFNVLQRPPVVVDVQCVGGSPQRKKLVYAPISPVQQTNTPLKNITCNPELKENEENLVVLKNDNVYNTYSKSRGRWDTQPSLKKTDQLLGHYCVNMLSYQDAESPEQMQQDDLETQMDLSFKTSQTPKSVTTSKTEGSNNTLTPAKFNDDSTSDNKNLTAVKISPPFLSMENSNNAMDNSTKILEKLNLKSDLSHEFVGPLSFENKIPKIKPKPKQKFGDALKLDEDSLSGGNVIQRDLENSRCAPSSPCLFSSDDNSDDENVNSANSQGAINKTQPQLEERDRLKLNDIELLKRLQKTLSGVLPPPSVTITQFNLTEMLDLYNTNIETYNATQLSLSKLISSDSILDNNSSTPPSLKTWVSLPSDLESRRFSETLDQSQTSQHGVHNKEKSSLLISCTLDTVLKAEWPEVMDCRYHGVHYNRSLVSEEFELLCMKFSERYIGAETQTSCTLGNKPYSQKNLAPRFAQSPGRRLSHLARRRQTFSSANLQAGCSLETKIRKPVASARQIMLSTKRTDNNNRKRYRAVTKRTPGRKTPGKKTPGRKTPGKRTPGRKTPSRKTPGKKTPGKGTPSTSTKKRKLVCRRIVPEDIDSSSSCSSSSMKPTRETSKRALFQSPPKTRERQFETEIPRTESTGSVRCDKAQRLKRTLFASPTRQGDPNTATYNNQNCDTNEPKKRVNLNSSTSSSSTKPQSSLFSPFKNTSTDTRKRKFSEIGDSSSQSSPKSKFPRSLSFNANSAPIGGKVLTRRASENVGCSTRVSSNCELSDNHRKKLLWAVAEALRSQNIGMSHPQFKNHAGILARLTRKLLLEDGQKVGSTSEKMLKLAKLHVFSVIRGKSVEEIMIEEQIRKAKASSSKVTGYVPLSEYEQSKISALNQRLIKPIIKDYSASDKASQDLTSDSDSNVFPLRHSDMNSDMESSNSLSKSVLQDKSLNLENSFQNSKTKARRQICFDECAKR